MADLKKDVKYVKGVGPNRAKLLNRLNIYTLEDLITYFPREHEDRSKSTKISEIVSNQEVLIEAYVTTKLTEFRVRPKLTIYRAMAKDETGYCQLIWYNQPYLKDKIKKGEKYRFFGKAINKLGKIEIVSPVFDEIENSKNTGKIIPIYPLTYDLSQNVIRKIIENGLNDVGELDETLPEYLVKEYNLYDYDKAIKQIHFPDNFENFSKARKRLAFEELLTMQIALLGLKNKYNNIKTGIEFSKEIKISDVINNLPFKLTNAQLRVLEEIDKDMESNKPMNRLLQGDVGSRKNCSCDDCCI